MMSASRPLRTFGYWMAIVIPCLILAWLFRWLSQAPGESGALLRAGMVAQMVSGNAALVVHLPNVAEAERAFLDSDAARVWSASPLRDFLTQPLSGVEDVATATGYWKQIVALEPTDAFAALGFKGEPMAPVLTIAFEQHSGERALGKMLDSLRVWLATIGGTPLTKPEESIEGLEVESFALEGGEAHLGRYGHWVFLTTDRDELGQMARRLASRNSRGETGTCLGNAGLFRSALQNLPGDYAMLAYLQALPQDRVELALEGLAHLSFLRPSWIERVGQTLRAGAATPFAAMATSSSVRDRKMVDYGTLVKKEADVTPVAPLEQRTLQLTSTETLCCVATTLGGREMRHLLFEPVRQRALALPEEPWFLAEWGFQLEPYEPTANQIAPVLVFALDLPHALDRYLEEQSQLPGGPVRRASLDAYSLATTGFPAPFSQFIEKFYLQVRGDLLIVTPRLDALPVLVRRWHQRENMTGSREYRRLFRRLPEPDVAVGYVDSRRLLGSGYEAMHHPLIVSALWLTIRSQTALDFDLAKLPRAEEVGAELTPTGFVLRTQDVGYRLASIGSISPSQWLLGSSLAAALANKTILEPLPAETEDPFVAPLESESLQDLMETLDF